MDSDGRREVNIVTRVMSATKDFCRSRKPQIRRKLTLTIWDDGNVVNQLDVEEKRSFQGDFSS